MYRHSQLWACDKTYSTQDKSLAECIRHKQVLTKYGRLEITSCFLFDHNRLKLEINEKNYRTYMNIEIEEYTIH